MRRNLYITLASLLLIVSIATTIHLHAQQQQSNHQQAMPDCPMMKEQGMAGMNERGDQGMGFSQEKTTHHFYLTKTGGSIQVEANEPQDTSSKEQIQELRQQYQDSAWAQKASV
jgi:predicted Zn-dependent protease